MSKASNSLEELKGLRKAVAAEERAKTQALLQNLPQSTANLPPAEPPEPMMEPDHDDEEVIAGFPPASPPPAPAKPSISSPAPPRPGAAGSQPAARNQVKAAKEPALVIPLTAKVQERLQKNVENARWSPAEMVAEMIRVTLHQGYPAIQFGDQALAKPGTYRIFERNPLENVLKIISGQGVFNVTVRPQSPEFQRWHSYFANQSAPNPEKSASQVCLFALQSYLENIEDFKAHGWTKNIPTDAFSVAPMG
jgi:hypothetical protein